MSKNYKINLESTIISKIKSEEIKMRPKYFFVLGSVILFTSLVGLSMGTIFLINLVFFFIRKNGPFYIWKLQNIISNFPLWIPILAIIGIFLSIKILKKYDFSYKKNFKLILIFFVLAILLAGLLLDTLGLNEYLSRGKMGKYYQQLNNKELMETPKGRNIKNFKQF